MNGKVRLVVAVSVATYVRSDRRKFAKSEDFSMSTWLVTGGAGYIGAHVVEALQAAGITPVVYDNLVSGKPNFVPEGVARVHGDVTDAQDVAQALQTHDVNGVIHLAGFKYAGVSVQQPVHTYEQNVGGVAAVLRGMQTAGVNNIVFSSSAAVFGNPDVDLVTEDTPKHPTSPYGESKLIGEWMLKDEHVARDIAFTCLRYFNVVGSGASMIYDASPHNLFPLIFDALLAGKTPKIFGTDYDTPDGTCMRDYVHVVDIARAHAAAAAKMDEGVALEPAYNLGSGDGASVGDIMRAAAKVTGIDFEAELAPRRAGDPARIVSSGELAARDLDWTMSHTLEEMLSSAWEARKHADVH